MRKYFTVFALFFTLIWSFAQIESVYPQNSVDNIPQLSIELWPDFDRPDVLVLVTGLLPLDTQLPAEITLPLPANVELNAVAKIDDDNAMSDDVQYTIDESAGTISIIAEALRFRLEYYAPYQKEGDQRSFRFDWTAPVDINAFALNVQQPRFADGFQLIPEASNVLDGQFELKYHNGRLQRIQKGQNIEIDLKYSLSDDILSTNQATPNQPSAQTLTQRIQDRWQQLIFPVAGFIISFMFLLYSLNRGRHQKQAATIKKVNCQSCGQHINQAQREESVKFCPNCGENLR